MVVWVIGLLVIYMLFLVVLERFILNRKQTSYQEHREEEVNMLAEAENLKENLEKRE